MPKPKRKADDAPTFTREHVEAAHRAVRRLFDALGWYEIDVTAPPRKPRKAGPPSARRRAARPRSPARPAATLHTSTLSEMLAAYQACQAAEIAGGRGAFQPIDSAAAPSSAHQQVVDEACTLLRALLGNAWNRFQRRDQLTDADRATIDAVDPARPRAAHDAWATELRKLVKRGTHAPEAELRRRCPELLPRMAAEKCFVLLGQDKNPLGARVADADRGELVVDPAAVWRNWKQIITCRLPERMRGYWEFVTLLDREFTVALDKARPLALTAEQRDLLALLANPPPKGWSNKTAAAALDISEPTFRTRRDRLRLSGLVAPDSNDLTPLGKMIAARERAASDRNSRKTRTR